MSLTPEWNGSLVGGILLTGDCVVVRVNQTAAKWLGFSQEALAGRSLHTLLGGGGQFFLHSQILPMLKLKGSLEEIYLRMKNGEGHTIPVLANIGYVAAEGAGRIELSFVRIIQRGRLEDELLQAKKLAEQASDAKTKFLGMMSHELRTPLQLMSLNNQLLLEDAMGPLSPEQREALESNQEANDSVVVIIDDILNFARMQGGPVQVMSETVEIERALVRAETSVRHRLAESGLAFHRECLPANLQAKADTNRLQQVLINLLNNAIKFTPRGGTITLTGELSDGMAAISVRDTGCGIPPDKLQSVFEPFVQLRTTIESTDKPGVGLGLAICRDLARAMGGRMEVRSVLGEGSTFSVKLPLA
ncbi:MAG TPA: PAS domain-containing sensor histidine kinase [Opitutaceae bacterium]|nr:PAS domain-containing sensor histidine kinase [Opitutaceae bacterium]